MSRIWPPSAGGDGRRSTAGFTLVELLVSMAIMLALSGAMFGLMSPGAGSFQLQPEASDMQQRLRTAMSLLHRDLLMAGAGSYTTGQAGPLNRFLAPVHPYRLGKIDPDPDRSVFYRPDALTVAFVPGTAAQSTILDPIATPTATVRIAARPGCPTADPGCGFAPGDTALVFDGTGASDTFFVSDVQQNRLALEVRGSTLAAAYPVGAPILRAVTRTYFLDDAAARLVRYDGWQEEWALVDDVVGFELRYYGDPQPPDAPRPPPGGTSCLFDAAGTPRLPVLPATHGALVELTETLLTDGPWCGGATPFDADLYRLRTIGVAVRVQAHADALRGRDPFQFRRPGDAVLGTRMLPDLEMRLEVSPRNLNVAR